MLQATVSPHRCQFLTIQERAPCLATPRPGHISAENTPLVGPSRFLRLARGLGVRIPLTINNLREEGLQAILNSQAW